MVLFSLLGLLFLLLFFLTCISCFFCAIPVCITANVVSSSAAQARCTQYNIVVPVMFSLVHDSHTEQALSSDCRTRNVYACSLTVVKLMLIFLWNNPSVLFASVVILFIWLSHLRSDCTGHPDSWLYLHVQVGVHVHVGCMNILLVFYFMWWIAQYICQFFIYLGWC